MSPQEAGELGIYYFTHGFSCAEAALKAISEAMDIHSDLIPKIATPFAGGICRRQHICGAVSGALMAVGMVLGRSEGGASREQCFSVRQALISHVENIHSCIDCRSILGYDDDDESVSEEYRKEVSKNVCAPLVDECCSFVVGQLYAIG